jgi:hypothetical protein
VLVSGNPSSTVKELMLLFTEYTEEIFTDRGSLALAVVSYPAFKKVLTTSIAPNN